MTPAAKSALVAHAWPGNVRELEHVLSRAALRAFNEQGRSVRWVAIEARHLGLGEPLPGWVDAIPDPALRGADEDLSADHAGQTLREATDDFQRRWITLEAGMDRSNFHRLARRLGVRGTDSR